MIAMTTLRRHLDEIGVHCEPRGAFATVIHVDGITWYAHDRYDGTMTLSLVDTLSPADVIKAIVGPTATMTSTCDDDGVGHSECNTCGRTVDKHMHFCPWCGAKFINKEGK